MFKTDIQSIRQNSNFTIQMEGSKVPDAISTYFRSKQNEIYHQYESARLFLCQAQEGSAQSSWDGWFNRLEDDKLQNMASWLFREKMFQAALMFYNIVVDLSWVLCYTSAEYVVYRDDNTVTFEKLITIEEAYGALRKEEENVVAPNARENPFHYLKKCCLPSPPPLTWSLIFGTNTVQQAFGICIISSSTEENQLSKKWITQ